MIRPALGGLVVLVLGATPLGGQVVRGRVTEVSSSFPVAGAVVSLLGDGSDTALVNVLTTASGEYAVRALQPGRYRLAVKRIGVKRSVSPFFELGAGETRVIDVPIDAIALTLPEVTVSGLCVTRARELSRIASLWEEARTALEATHISIRDRLMAAGISRYAAELDPGNLRVMFDWRSDAQVMTNQPFTSLSGDSLSAVGYWRQLSGDSAEFLAPDASALASNAFIHDHCFAIAGTHRGRPDLTGLTFVPAAGRRLPDISGTVWLDARSYELRFIEFRYTRLPDMPNANRVGGEVHFARLDSGAWIVDRWFIRMPQTITLPDALFPRTQLREEGGTVITEGVDPSTRSASLTGVIRDSLGRGLAGAVVRAIGTHRQVLSDADGAFHFDRLPPGEVSIVVHADGYDSFGVLAASRRVALQAGRSHRIELRAPNSGAIRRETCPPTRTVSYARTIPRRGALRLMVVDSATSVPIPGIRLIAVWPAALEDPASPPDGERFRQAVTDNRGAATFCDLPAGITVEVATLNVLGHRSHVLMAQLDADGITGRVVMVRMNR